MNVTWVTNSLYNTKPFSKREFKSQQAAFRGASFLLLVVGYFIGLNPVTGALGQDASKIRFEVVSFKTIYSLILCLLQTLTAISGLVNIFKNSITIVTLGNVTYYGTTSITTILFLRLAMRWRLLIKEVSSPRLNEYIDPYIQLKCSLAAVIILSLALLEHILSIIRRLAHLNDCVTEKEDIYKAYLKTNFPWFSDLSNVPLFILAILLNVVCTLNWNYSHVFIICMSLYLSSVVEQINKKLLAAEGQFVPSSFWRSLREEYNAAARLVRTFDGNINSIIFISFASNLFFVCLQLFYVFSNGLNFNDLPDKNCPNFGSGLFHGFEYVVYMSFSVTFVLGRSLSVALIASRVHSASLVAAPVLYAVPSPVYCLEVQRFIEQVHGDSVALTGMNFFKVTRGLVLSVAGTIVTYELVLLQFT